MVNIVSFSDKEQEKRVSGERSKTPASRSRSSRSARQKAFQEVAQKQEHNQELGSFKEAIIRVFLKDSPTFLRTLLTIACLFVLIQTRDASWIVTAFAIASGSSNLPIVKTLLPTYKGSSQKEDEAP